MNAHEKLSQIKRLDELIKAKLAERDELLALATNCVAVLDGMPHGSDVSDRVGNVAVKLAMLSKETDRLIDKYVDLKQEIIRALEQLPTMEYAVLHRYYIRFMTLEEIAEDLDYSVMQIWRIKKKSLKDLESVIECYVGTGI